MIETGLQSTVYELWFTVITDVQMHKQHRIMRMVSTPDDFGGLEFFTFFMEDTLEKLYGKMIFITEYLLTN